MNEDTERRLALLEQQDPVDDILVDNFIYIENFYIPNVVKLDLTVVPTFPFELVPTISQLRLTSAKQDVVIEERLKLIEVHELIIGKMSISADSLTITVAPLMKRLISWQIRCLSIPTPRARGQITLIRRTRIASN